MKKLMILAATAAIGFAANAATCNWSADGVAEYGTTDLATGYAAYFINSADYAYSSAVTDLAKGDYSFLSYGFGDGSTDEGEVYGTTTGHENGETINGYLVVFDSDSAASAEHYYITEEGSGAIGKSGQAATIYFDASATESTSNWQSVPEPTSGLLLLLGVAGLALKRRRA